VAIETGLRTLLLAQSSITTLAPAQTVGGLSIDAVFLDHPIHTGDSTAQAERCGGVTSTSIATPATDRQRLR
jgi:hypothetical protein